MRYPLLIAALVFLVQCRSPDGADGPAPAPPPGPALTGDLILIEDEVDGVPLALVGNQALNFVQAFDRRFRGERLDFRPVQGRFPIVLEDQHGNQWDAFGQARSGPQAGERLRVPNSGMGYWFVFGAMYPGIGIYGEAPIAVEVDRSPADDWAIPTRAVAQGSGFASIAALDNPRFERYQNQLPDPERAAFLEDDDLVIAVSLNGETKVYPHAILDWHEIVNDQLGGEPITLTYCPLTGTGKVWRGQETGPRYAFGVSGLLYNSNVLPFDRASQSIWTQLEGRAVFGPRRGEQLQLLPFVETSWRTWSRGRIESLVLSEDTGIDRDYKVYPYGDYRDSELIAYPLLYRDDRLPAKERVFAVLLPGAAKIFRLDAF